MNALKSKIKNACDKLVTMSKKVLSFAIEYVVTVGIICAIGIAVLKAPEMHNKFYHAKVGSKVYMIQDSYTSGGGTGFAIKAPSGISYILTNDHVCGVSSDGRTVLVSGTNDVVMRRQIIAHDPNSDLCLIEGIPGVEGLSVAWSGPSIGDTLTVVGHPHLMPMHVSQGELTGSKDVTVMLGPISVVDPKTGKEELIDPKKGGIPASECTMPKNTIADVEMDLMFVVLKVKLCLATVKDAYITGVTIFPGNSGSPVVNFWGNVEGVAFAGNDTNWGLMVPIQDVKAFLKNF